MNIEQRMGSVHRASARRPPALACLSLLALFAFSTSKAASSDDGLHVIDELIAAHPGQSAAYVLDSSEEALLARAWLADHAEHTIEVQYFIWSTDNIGILAAEALLRAAERGVKVRIIVDDLLVDASSDSLLALASHPNFDIRIYNPRVSVGVSWGRRAWNAVTDLRGVNQRMHDKTFVVDGKVAITGGRNMASEYYDYHHEYNFRDRDALLAGQVVTSMRQSFERFWTSQFTVPVESIFSSNRVSTASREEIYRQLHIYAKQPDNFALTVRRAIDSSESAFKRIVATATWGRVDFVCDVPGKNAENSGLSGGGQSGKLLKDLVTGAKAQVLIQSPYLVPSDRALELFRDARQRNVDIRISTNSLASTDNLQAFAGYRSNRTELREMGIHIFEYKPNAATQSHARASELVGVLPAGKEKNPTFGLHAKTLVVDSKVVFIGTYNLDPRSENLNTEAGVIIYNEATARKVADAIALDMESPNSWDAAKDDPDQYASLAKRNKVRFWQLLPLKPLL